MKPAALSCFAAALLLCACNGVFMGDTSHRPNVSGLHIEQHPYFRLPADFSTPTGSGKVYIWFTNSLNRDYFANPKQRESANCHALVTDREGKILRQRQDDCVKLLQLNRIAY